MGALEDLEAVVSSEGLEKRLFDDAVLGDDTLKFINSPVGRSLVERAKDDFMKALLELVDVDLQRDPVLANALQHKARVAKSVISYLGDNIRAGEQALSSLEAREEGA